jgi:Ca2+-binding RTX toxin-like protein
VGGSGNDSLDGGAGNDVFVFSANSGKDVLAGFVAGATSADVLKFVGIYSDFAAILAVTHDETGVTSPFGTSFSGTIIGTGADQIWLSGVTKAQLNAVDFVFA